MWPALIALSTTASLAFPADPIPGEMARGAEIYRKGKGIERTLLEDRVVLGLWFSGRKQEDVEEVIRLSPEMVSRWIGYLKAKERWSEETLNQRWDHIAEAMGEDTHFVVRLSAFPKMTLEDLEPALSRSADPNEISNVRFAFEIECGAKDPSAMLLETSQTRDWKSLGDFKWYLSLPYGEALRPEFATTDDGWSYPVGDYYSAWYLVRIPNHVVDLREPQSLLVFSKEKTRVARYNQQKGKSARSRK